MASEKVPHIQRQMRNGGAPIRYRLWFLFGKWMRETPQGRMVTAEEDRMDEEAMLRDEKRAT